MRRSHHLQAILACHPLLRQAHHGLTQLPRSFEQTTPTPLECVSLMFTIYIYGVLQEEALHDLAFNDPSLSIKLYHTAPSSILLSRKCEA